MKTKKKKFNIEISGEFFCQGMEMTGKNPGKTLVVFMGGNMWVSRNYSLLRRIFCVSK